MSVLVNEMQENEYLKEYLNCKVYQIKIRAFWTFKNCGFAAENPAATARMKNNK